MKICPFDSKHGKFTNAGLSVHIAKIHKAELKAQLKPCPHPFCKKSFPSDQMRAHWEEEHDTWKMHDGRFVWEVLDE